MRNKIIVLLIAVLFSVPAFSSAETIFTDNFNSYDEGPLNGQGSWTATSSRFEIQAYDVFEGAKAVTIYQPELGFISAEKSSSPVNDGSFTIYIKRHMGFTSNPSIWIKLREGARVIAYIINSSDSAYFSGDRGTYVSYGPAFPQDTWYPVQMQWRSSDHRIRYSVNNGAWTDWARGMDEWVTGLDTVSISVNNGVTYFDTIQENLFTSRNPVLIVPGLLGTEMKKGDELLWPNVTKMVTNITDNFMDPLQFEQNLVPTDNNVVIDKLVGEPFPGEHYYDLLINEFIGQNYIKNETLFTFPYDWRYGVSGKYADNTTNVDLLAQKIQDIKQQTGASEVDVVAHSLGGLLVKQYAIERPADNSIGKAVFVGVPNTGAPKAVKVLLQGDNFNVLGLNDNEIKKIAENMPASYDLLPSQQYYDNNGSYVKTINIDIGNMVFEEKELNYQDTKSFLTSDHGFNSTALAGTESLHTNSFDNYDLRTAGIDVYSINGCKSATINKITETKKTNIFGYTTTIYNIQEATGDGTVPLTSANSNPADTSHIFYALKPDHGKMPSQQGIRQQIVNLISGSSLNAGNNIITKAELDQDPNKCQLTGFWLSKHSPVSIEVLDQSGNRAGIAQDQSIQNNIPGADYQTMGEQAFVFIPTDENQNYTINLKGQGNGTFTFKNSEIINGQTIKTEVFSNLAVTPALLAQVSIVNGATTLLLDVNGDGTTDQSVRPSAVVGPGQYDDPPVFKHQCKKGGWKNFGSRFKNQGDCVSFVEKQSH